MQDWLNAPAKDPVKGADLLLAVTRNRALTNSYRVRPQKYQAKVEYELRKHLALRLDRKTVADAMAMEEAVMPRVEAFISTSDELPQGGRHSGKRPDHDSLPDAIKELWESNAARYRRVVLLFNELKAMGDLQPCDRYEHLKLLDEAERKCREDLDLYDSFDASTYTPPKPPLDEETKKAVNAARKALSKYRGILREAEPGSERHASALAKVEAAVSVIAGAGGGFTDEMMEELAGYGIRV